MVWVPLLQLIIIIINHSCKAHFQLLTTLVYALYTHTHTHIGTHTTNTTADTHRQITDLTKHYYSNLFARQDPTGVWLVLQITSMKMFQLQFHSGFVQEGTSSMKFTQ